MRKLMCVIGIALLVVAVTGCGEKADPEESREAQNLINGVGIMGTGVHFINLS